MNMFLKKTKWVRENNKSHMNKFLIRAIMKRLKLKNKATKTKHPVDIKIYKKQRNYVVGLNRINSVQFRGSLLWKNLPISVKESVSVKEFKQKLNHVQRIHCSCVACRRF